MPLGFKTHSWVAKTGSKKVHYRYSGKTEQVTIVAWASNVGQALPLMVIFNTKNLNHTWTRNEVSGSKYRLSDKSWILFEGWLIEHFFEYAVPGHPLLLFLMATGHITNLAVMQLTRSMTLYYICPHKSQPLDCIVFGTLKGKWSEVCHWFFQKTLGRWSQRLMLFSEALKSPISANIIAQFRKCSGYS